MYPPKGPNVRNEYLKNQKKIQVLSLAEGSLDLDLDPRSFIFLHSVVVVSSSYPVPPLGLLHPIATRVLLGLPTLVIIAMSPSLSGSLSVSSSSSSELSLPSS